jgi:alpha-L-fucosidase
MIRELQPDIVIWNDGGDRADLRWVGTEAGYVGETNWSLLDSLGEVTWPMLHFGLETGNAWVPAEVNTSIRPEWFYHPSEDEKVKTLPHLMDTWYKSIGRNGTFLAELPDYAKRFDSPEPMKRLPLTWRRLLRKHLLLTWPINAKAEASNVRGNARKFGANKAIDSNTDTYWATDDSYDSIIDHRLWKTNHF